MFNTKNTFVPKYEMRHPPIGLFVVLKGVDFTDFEKVEGMTPKSNI